MREAIGAELEPPPELDPLLPQPERKTIKGSRTKSAALAEGARGANWFWLECACGGANVVASVDGRKLEGNIEPSQKPVVNELNMIVPWDGGCFGMGVPKE